MSKKKYLYAKFLKEEILHEQGRLLFSLLNVFSSEGYQILLFDNLSNRDLDKYGDMALSLQSLNLTDSYPGHPEEWIYLFDKEDRAMRGLAWQKKIQVRYDIFSPYWFQQPIIMPFPMHPVHIKDDLEQRLEKLRTIKKCMRVFFSGDTKNYVRNRVQYPKEKLPRSVIIDTILERMENKVFNVEDSMYLNSLETTAYINKVVLVNTNKTWVDDRNWLGNLARSDFFLSPPGIVMPMCHNIIEAMAVGSIPITNYPEWFDPDLEHMKNCIAFEDQDDLISKLNLALKMDREKIAEMRENTLGYYQSYLRSVTFLKRIESSDKKKTIVLLITEGNMARKPSKLNRNSVLIRGTMSGNTKSWVDTILSVISHK